MIKVDISRCLGCSACSNVCPNKNITKEDDDGKRTIRFAQCREECDLCVEFCPGKALTLVPEAEETVVVLDLVPCQVCGTPFATEPTQKRVASTIPPHLQRDSSGLYWIDVCPPCRRELEGERALRHRVLTRL